MRLHDIGRGVWIATSRKYVTNTTVILDGTGGALIIDPSWDEDELAAIPSDLRELKVGATSGLATHWHYDHILWHPDLGDAPRWSSPTSVDIVTSRRQSVLEPLIGDLPNHLLDIAGLLEPLPGDALPWNGPTARCWFHNAHAEGHLALEIEQQQVLVVGDMLSDVELPMPGDHESDLVAYAEGLDVLADPVSRARLLIPGHGTPSTSPMERLDADRRYLDDLLTKGTSDDPRISMPDMASLHARNVERARQLK